MPSGPKKRKAAKKKQQKNETYTVQENPTSFEQKSACKIETVDQNAAPHSEISEDAISRQVHKDHVQISADDHGLVLQELEDHVVLEQEGGDLDVGVVDGFHDLVVQEITFDPNSLPIKSDDLEIDILTVGKLKSTTEQVERFKMTVIEELRVANKFRAFLQRVLDDLDILQT